MKESSDHMETRGPVTQELHGSGYRCLCGGSALTADMRTENYQILMIHISELISGLRSVAAQTHEYISIAASISLCLFQFLVS